MKHLLAAVVKHFRSRALASAAPLLLAASSVPAAYARQAPIPVGPRRDPEVERVRDEQRREMQLRRMSEAAARRRDVNAIKAAVKQLGEDFQRIQVIRNEVARALAAGAPLDYARVSEQAGEVRKRAQRMQSVLALRDPSAEEKRQPEAEAAHGEEKLKGALVLLCKRIDSFVSNPKFRSPGVVDVEADARAGRDLRDIIALSAGVREGAGRLGHHAAPPPPGGPEH